MVTLIFHPLTQKLEPPYTTIEKETAPEDSVGYYLFFKRVIFREWGYSTAGSYSLVA